MRNLERAFLIITLLLVSGCSTSFNRKWEAAREVSTTPTDLTGAWEGFWRSRENNHEGPLRCVVTPNAHTPGAYDFHYWAQWGIFRGDFETTYPVRSDGPKRWAFDGESDLGWLGGIYRHRGQATPEQFSAWFSSPTRGDRGLMRMSRPASD